MSLHRLAPGAAASRRVRRALDALRQENDVPPAFPPDVLAEAEAVARAWEKLDWGEPNGPATPGPATPGPATPVPATPGPATPGPAAPGDGGPAGRPPQDCAGFAPLPLPPQAVARARASLPGRVPTLDLRQLPLVTIDPPGSRDLDQAVHIERASEGRRPERGAANRATEPGGQAAFVVHYAIASLATFVAPGGPLDREVRARALTVYAPDFATALHPPVLSEGAASLLPGKDRPAYVWRFELDSAGQVIAMDLRHALVRSRAQLSYGQVQHALDTGESLEAAPELPQLLREVGTLRRARELERGGISLRTPSQEVERVEGGYRLTYAATLPVEEWNAQISLLTGMEAARIMGQAGVGILRTLPPAGPEEIARLRLTARVLGLEWDQEQSYAQFVRGLSSHIPAHAAFLTATTTLFRGANYLPFGGPCPPLPVGDAAALTHGSIAAPYAHVTAPLRRLVDRFGLEICLAAVEGEEEPAWVLEALPALPSQMSAGSRRARAVDSGAVAALEALVLAGQEGATFRAVLLEVNRDSAQGVAMLAEPAVIIPVTGSGLAVASEVEVRVTGVDVPSRAVTAVVV
ncbi:RNB domain-containing ribonuclease [Buchananella felis]|uniref:RNB domain-containing ribonuclease n=1 Tax=Buchananella felis TaxID=3231492 RepID=UPI0035295782